ncbi:MAG: DUF1631 domain-containing protein [Rudaea sp.]
MTSKNDGNKVISLPNRQPAVQPKVDRLGEPLHSLRDLFQRRMGELVNGLFDKVDDALFDRAESAQTNTLQTQCFEGMREVRRKRQRAERLTLDRIGQVFIDFAMGKLQAPVVESATAVAGTLSLVEDHELEESLAITSMVAKSETRLARALYALNRRLSALRGGAPVENATNPMGPAQMCDTFRIGMAELDVELAVRIIIYKLYDRHVLSGIEPLYEEVNAHLIQVGVLPELRPQHAHSGSGASAARAAAAAAAAAHSGAQTGEGDARGEGAAPGSIESEIYSTLRSLMAMRHGNTQPLPAAETAAVAAPVAGPQMSLAPTDLLSALQILQNQTLQMQAQAAAQALPNATNLKQALIDEADRLHSGPKAKVASVDEDTIDLVGMLFEFIVQDRNLPSEMHALLGRLQIPFLKIAILDRHLFSQKTHPARQLLDNLAQACIGKADGADNDPALHNKIREIVETILRDFDDDMSLIERANNDFSTFIASTRLRSDLAEKRTAETVQGREKLDQARRIASSEVRKRTEGRSLPALIQSLLSGPFAQLLVLVELRQGQESADWRQALSFADALIWSVQPKATNADTIKLQNLLPSMKAYLRQGLVKVGWQDSDTDNIIRQLDVYYRHHLETSRESKVDEALTQVFSPLTRAGAREAAQREVERQLAKEAPAVEALVTMMDRSAIAEPAPVEPDIEQLDVDAAYLEQVNAMKVGTWIEFNNPATGMRERAKLSWISPISSKYLFVDRKGLKVADKTITELAAEFSAGRATMLDDSMPLFDRALTAVVERLKTFQPKLA